MDLRVRQGQTIRLPAVFFSGDIPTDPVRPRVNIVDPGGVTVIGQGVPSRIRTGFFHYDYAVAPDAQVGTWRAEWTAVLGGYEQAETDRFEVLPALAPDPGRRSKLSGRQGWTVEGSD